MIADNFLCSSPSSVALSLGGSGVLRILALEKEVKQQWRMMVCQYWLIVHCCYLWGLIASMCDASRRIIPRAGFDLCIIMGQNGLGATRIRYQAGDRLN